jgi:hypothetical protein
MSNGAADEALRRLYRRAVTHPVGGDPHPDEAAWERVFSNDATTDERRRLMDHVVGCAQCADIYRSLTVVRREAAAFDPGVPAPVRSATPSMRLVAYAAAAVLVLAVAVPMTWRIWHAAPPPAAEPASATPPAQARALRDHPAFRLDKPAVILSAAAVLTRRRRRPAGISGGARPRPRRVPRGRLRAGGAKPRHAQPDVSVGRRAAAVRGNLPADAEPSGRRGVQAGARAIAGER